MAREWGQATVEAVAAVALLVLSGVVALQLLVAGYVLTLADGAAEAGALALAAGRPPKEAARAALPGWAESDLAVGVQGAEVSVRLRPPSLLPAVGRHLAITSTAFARPAAR